MNDIGLKCKKLIEYVKAERKVAEYYSLPVLNLYANSGIQPSIKIIQEKYIPDGLRSQKIANLLVGFLSRF